MFVFCRLLFDYAPWFDFGFGLLDVGFCLIWLFGVLDVMVGGFDLLLFVL